MVNKSVSWKSLRISAINRLSKRKGWRCDDANPFFNEYEKVTKSQAKNKKQYKEQQWISANGNQ